MSDQAKAMHKLFETFLANRPVTDEKGQFEISHFIENESARLLAGFMAETCGRDARANADSIFKNGVLYGIMLSELGLARYITREQSGEIKQPEPEKPSVICLGDKSRS